MEKPPKNARMMHLGGWLMIAMWRDREQGLKWGANLEDASDFKSLQASLWEHSDTSVTTVTGGEPEQVQQRMAVCSSRRSYMDRGRHEPVKFGLLLLI